MKVYHRTHPIQAMTIAWCHGYAVSETLPDKGERYPPASDQVILPATFIRDNKVEVGKVIIFEQGSPVKIMTKRQFDELYIAEVVAKKKAAVKKK
jgi:hypothetical protein